MDHMENDLASNDDTTIISELLNSSEAMPSMVTSTAPTNPVATNEQLIQKDENEKLSEFTKDCNNHDIMVPLKCNNMINNNYVDLLENANNMQQIRHVHIPYILNGELYQIQTQDGENVTVKCCHCPPDRVYRGSVRSTGNFHMHIKRRHPDLLEKLHDMKVNALLERRDRLMRNRKITHRNNRNRPATTIAAASAVIRSFKSEPLLCPDTPTDSQLALATTSDINLLQTTHNLKIKTVFQRHQMQQREAAEMRNWNNKNYVVMPIDKLTTNDNNEEPMNLSLKSQENNETDVCSSLSTTQQQEKQQEQQNTTQSSNNFADLSKQPTSSSYANEDNEFDYENEANIRNLSASSISLSCPSVMSSYSSNHHYNMKTNNHQYKHSHPHHHHPHHLHNLSIIKPENLLIPIDAKAIDLTMHNDSGIFSNSNNTTTTSDNSINIDSQNNMNGNRAGSQITTALNTTSDIVDSSCSNSNTKWQELLMHVETSLRDIQREMNVRNQIESNRMFLDIAKFKFLHPGFQFNW